MPLPTEERGRIFSNASIDFGIDRAQFVVDSDSKRGPRQFRGDGRRQCGYVVGRKTRK